MSDMPTFICLLVALVAFAAATLSDKRKVDLIALGLGAWLLPALWAAGQAAF